MSDTAWVREGPQTLREGQEKRFAVVWEGAATVTSGTDEIYANGSTQTVLTGSISIVGNVESTRLLTVPSGAGGLTYVWEVAAVVDGNLTKAGVQIEILKPGQEM